MQDVLVTVFCAAYNHEQYIRDALDGFVRQKTTFPFEVIVHDDASTDKTADIIREYEKKYPEIIKPIYQPENIYGKKNRIFTYMLPKTRGKYIALCEGDDYWTDDYKLQKQVDYIEAHPECSLVAHKAKILYCDDGKMFNYSDIDFSDTNWDVPKKTAISNFGLFPTASMLFKKDYYYANESFLRNRSVFDFGAKILLATEGKVHIIPDVMSVYRKNTAGSWTQRISRNKKENIAHIEKSIEIIGAINEYRNFKYDDILQEVILQRKASLELALGNFSLLRKEPYKKFYDSLPFQVKIDAYMKKYCPWLLQFGRRIWHYFKMFK